MHESLCNDILPFFSCRCKFVNNLPRKYSVEHNIENNAQKTIMFRRSNTYLAVKYAGIFRNIGLVFCCVLILSWVSFVAGELPDNSELRKLLLNTSTKGISYELLRNHFDKLTGFESEKVARPRLFPLCVQASTLKEYLPLKNFVHIWEEIDNQAGCESRPLHFYEYNASLHSMLHNKDWIESISLSRINTPETDVRNMRQWMHITVKATTSLLALYLQPIVGTIGLSSGEFSLDFPCKDIQDTSAQDSMIFHCDYRSRAELNHPIGFFGGYAGAKQFKEFHVHYKWNDISCLETPFLQFILIAIKNFKVDPKWGVDFLPLLSPVYTNFDFDSHDGVITPYHVDWKDSMTCFATLDWTESNTLYHDSKFAGLSWKETNILDRLFVNEEFDECVSGVKTDDRDENHRECGPGPFECPEELSLNTVEKKSGFLPIVERRQQEFEHAKSLTDCSPCILPRKQEIMHPKCITPIMRMQASARQGSGTGVDRDLDHFLYLDYSEYLSSSIEARYHGAIAILVYVAVNPFGIFIARFYRGIPVHHMHKDDFWILIHSLIHLVGFILLWISIGFVSTMDEGIVRTGAHCYREAEEVKYNSTLLNSDWTQESYLEWLDNCTFKSRKNSHSNIGILSIVIHNFNMLLSFFRSRSDFVRNIQVIAHAHLGYIDMVLSFLAIVVAVEGQQCSEILAYCIVMIFCTTMAFLTAMCVTSAEDKKLGVEPPRYKWPILEPIRLAHSGPYYEAKMAIIGVYGGVLLLVWILCVVSQSRGNISEINVIGGIEKGSTFYGGIFKTCKIPDLFKPKLEDY